MLLADPGSRPDGAALGSALREATGKARLDAVQALVRAGAEVDAADELGRRASWLAAWNGRADILGVLLSAGAKVDSRTGFGDTPLHAAARFGGAAIVRALLAAGADPDATNSLGDTPLSCAAEAPSAPAQVVDLLLDARAHIDHANAHGQTALMLATRNVLDKGSPSAFDRLVERGAALDLVDDEGRTALLHGILISNYDFARAIRLVDAGADPGVKDHAGRTAADYLARYSDIDAAHAIRALLGVQQATP